MWKKHDLLSWLAVEKDPDRKMDPNGVKIAHQSHWHAQYIQCRAQHRVQDHTEYSQSQKKTKHKLHKYIPSNPNGDKIAHQSHYHTQYTVHIFVRCVVHYTTQRTKSATNFDLNVSRDDMLKFDKFM